MTGNIVTEIRLEKLPYNQLCEELYKLRVILAPPPTFMDRQPWCRVCRAGATKWHWTRHDDAFDEITVHCHGESCSALIQHMPEDCTIEAFCHDEPHIKGTLIWFVGHNGAEMQPSPQYLAEAHQRFFSGWFGTLVRKKFPRWAVGAIPLLILDLLLDLVILWIWSTWR